jgi:hypothetical protein
MDDSPPGLRVLNAITIESPCPAPWDRMKGKDHVRYCEECRKDVFDVSEMTTAEATRLLLDGESTPCIRLCRTAEGLVITADHVPGVRGKIWHKLRRHAPWAASLFAMLFLPGCTSLMNSLLATQGFVVRSVKSTTDSPGVAAPPAQSKNVPAETGSDSSTLQEPESRK